MRYTQLAQKRRNYGTNITVTNTVMYAFYYDIQFLDKCTYLYD
jgi:hypothetical protein